MKLLVATDGSKDSLDAVKYALKLSEDMRSNSSITLISVHDDAALNHASQFVGKDEVEDYLRDQSEKELKSARKLLDDAKVEHDHATVVGHVSDEIVKYADEGRYDLIVMGSKGRGGLADLLIGSVAQRVLSDAKQPVLLVK